MPESAYERARKASKTSLVKCEGEGCKTKLEEKEMDGNLCPNCSVEDMRATQEAESRQFRYSGI